MLSSTIIFFGMAMSYGQTRLPATQKVTPLEEVVTEGKSAVRGNPLKGEAPSESSAATLQENTIAEGKGTVRGDPLKEEASSIIL